MSMGIYGVHKFVLQYAGTLYCLFYYAVSISVELIDKMYDELQRIWVEASLSNGGTIQALAWSGQRK